jgi:hypothetical protein
MNTNDLSKLGYREIDQLADLLKAYANNPDDCGLNDGVTWEYNPNSDNLFLVDEDFNIAMFNPNSEKDGLEKFYNCPNCGHEGFKDDFCRERKEDGKTFIACSECEKNGCNPEDYLIQL